MRRIPAPNPYIPQRAGFTILSISLAAVALLAAPSTVRGEEHACRIESGFHAAGGAPGREAPRPDYAPDPLADFLHVVIDVTPDFDARRISGRTTITFAPLGRPLRSLTLHGIDLSPAVESASAPVSGIDVREEEIVVTFEREIPPGEEVTLTLSHSAEPRRGLYFRTPAMGYKPGDTHLWTQGEMHEARHWFPAFDYPNERFTSEMICQVPADMTVLSNGRLAGDEIDADSGLRTVRWAQDKPHVNYLIALAAGYFETVRGEYRGIPMAFHTPPSQTAHAARTFDGTIGMMEYFEREIGVPYPWNKYDQVVVDDFHWGGMENTTLTILNDRALHAPETENVRSARNLIAHELAHQWFGDLTTTKDWSHIWLNEGFATYYANLYEEHSQGRDAMLYALYRDAAVIFEAEKNGEGKPVAWRVYDDPKEQFGYRAYDKGGWVLHMLRTQLGQELYRECVRVYLERNQFRSVVTADLTLVIEEHSGRSMDRFFDQWIFRGGHPELEVSHSWDEAAGLARLSVRQTQKFDSGSEVFHFPTRVRYRVGGRTMDRELVMSEREQDFYFALPGKPDLVRFDPEYGVLARVKFSLPADMLREQLKSCDDAIGRILAAAELGGKDDAKTVRALGAALREDSFFGVRIEAARALRGIHTPEALGELLAGADQPDARVRLETVTAIGGHFRPEARESLVKTAAGESNPAVRAAAIRALDKFADDEVRSLLLNALDTESYRDDVAGAAMDAIGGTEDPAYVPVLLSVLAEREGTMPSRVFASGLESLARIARHQEERGVVREFLSARVNHPKMRVRMGAITALGDLGDTRAKTVLEVPAGMKTDLQVSSAARGALEKLRASEKSPAGMTGLRGDFTRLRDEHEALLKRFEDLVEKTEARAKAGEADADGPESGAADSAPDKAGSDD